jgi:rhodanese-related sulfurtransferase
VDAMKKAGITEIYELETGTNGWTADGQPLVR